MRRAAVKVCQQARHKSRQKTIAMQRLRQQKRQQWDSHHQRKIERRLKRMVGFAIAL